MSVRRQMRVPLSRGVILVPQEGLHVVQRNPVLHQPRGARVAHDPRRETAHPSRGDRRVPHPVTEVLIGDLGAGADHYLVGSVRLPVGGG